MAGRSGPRQSRPTGKPSDAYQGLRSPDDPGPFKSQPGADGHRGAAEHPGAFGPLPEQQARERLAPLQGPQFDIEILRIQQQDHQRTAQLLEYEIGSGVIQR